MLREGYQLPHAASREERHGCSERLTLHNALPALTLRKPLGSMAQPCRRIKTKYIESFGSVGVHWESGEEGVEK